MINMYLSLFFNPVLKLDASEIFEMFQIFCYHDHVVDDGSASYQ